MVYISFPTEWGTIYSEQELKEIRKVCDEYEMYLFVDGARLGYGLGSVKNDLTLESAGSHKYRSGKEQHLYNPQTIHTLQVATRTGSYDSV